MTTGGAISPNRTRHFIHGNLITIAWFASSMLAVLIFVSVRTAT